MGIPLCASVHYAIITWLLNFLPSNSEVLCVFASFPSFFLSHPNYNIVLQIAFESNSLGVLGCYILDKYIPYSEP